MTQAPKELRKWQQTAPTLAYPGGLSLLNKRRPSGHWSIGDRQIRTGVPCHGSLYSWLPKL